MSEADSFLGAYLGQKVDHPCGWCRGNAIELTRGEIAFGSPYICSECLLKFLNVDNENLGTEIVVPLIYGGNDGV